MFEKILVANRGEIAVRIIRACKELNIRTVAVYSEADANSMHVQMADEAICIGKAAASESYLRIDRIISAAEITDVDAIHPGYGFLSENAHFADVCESCNIRFIGPSSRAMNALEDKAVSRALAKKAGVPTPPGSEGVVDNEQDALAVAKRIGYPVMIKAIAGGGGRGHARGAQRHFAGQGLPHGARRGGKGLRQLRGLHREVHREPAPHRVPDPGRQQGAHHPPGRTRLLDPAPQPEGGRRNPLAAAGEPKFKKLREKMGKAAIEIAEAANYTNAGTVEFIVDDQGNFYFLEVNKRIQVEHPITEEVTGH